MSDNRFGLVYRGAITENLPDQVNIHAVDYATVNGVDITANVYTPAGYSASSAAGYPVVVVHLNGGVKEEVAGLFAQKLAEHGFVTIAADAAY